MCPWAGLSLPTNYPPETLSPHNFVGTDLTERCGAGGSTRPGLVVAWQCGGRGLVASVGHPPPLQASWREPGQRLGEPHQPSRGSGPGPEYGGQGREGAKGPRDGRHDLFRKTWLCGYVVGWCWDENWQICPEISELIGWLAVWPGKLPGSLGHFWTGPETHKREEFGWKVDILYRYRYTI